MDVYWICKSGLYNVTLTFGSLLFELVYKIDRQTAAQLGWLNLNDTTFSYSDNIDCQRVHPHCDKFSCLLASCFVIEWWSVLISSFTSVYKGYVKWII